MQANYTHISFVLDRSGSMRTIKPDTIGGFNQFLEDQKKAPGKATMTLVQFDNEYEVLQSMVDIQAIPPLTDATFVPRGSTALLDAIGRTINETGKSLGDMPETERPEKVLFVILTDGQENSSVRFSNPKINEMITHQRGTYKWEFVFLAANQDAIATAARMGIGAASAMTYTADAAGAAASFSALSRETISYRSSGAKDFSFSDEDREGSDSKTKGKK